MLASILAPGTVGPAFAGTIPVAPAPEIPGFHTEPEDTVPNAPTNVGGIPGNASLIATWGAATTVVGGSRITGYVVVIANTVTGEYLRRSVAAAKTSVAVAGLTNETLYLVEVGATSAAGPSLTSLGTMIPSATATAAPGAPTRVRATSGKASATVSWTPSVFDAGSPTTEYSVRVVNAATNRNVGAVRSAGAATSLRVMGLANGTAVRFRVRATNAVGTGRYSALSAPVTPATVPTQLAIGTASSGTAGGTINARARWSAPGFNGGSAVTGYVVTAFGMNAAGTGAVSRTTSALQAPTLRSLTMTLKAGRYRFSVRASNSVGLAVASTRSNLVTAR